MQVQGLIPNVLAYHSCKCNFTRSRMNTGRASTCQEGVNSDPLRLDRVRIWVLLPNSLIGPPCRVVHHKIYNNKGTETRRDVFGCYENGIQDVRKMRQEVFGWSERGGKLKIGTKCRMSESWEWSRRWITKGLKKADVEGEEREALYIYGEGNEKWGWVVFKIYNFY